MFILATWLWTALTSLTSFLDTRNRFRVGRQNFVQEEGGVMIAITQLTKKISHNLAREVVTNYFLSSVVTTPFMMMMMSSAASVLEFCELLSWSVILFLAHREHRL